MNKAFIDKIEKHTYGGINLLELDHDSQKHTLKSSELKDANTQNITHYQREENTKTEPSIGNEIRKWEQTTKYI